MKRIIFFGGLQYSGKSSLARDLEAKNPARYVHLEMDALTETLTRRRAIFTGLIKRYDPNLYEEVRQIGEEIGTKGDYNLLTLLANYKIAQRRFSEFADMQQSYVVRYAGETIAGLKRKMTPLVEGGFTNKISRSITYKALQQSFGRKISLDETQKIFVYFNLGLDLSLNRFKENGKRELASMTWSEDLIRKTFKEQEIPKSKEFPNLEVVVINNFEDLQQCQEMLAACA